MRKKGMAAPATREAIEPITSLIFSEGVVYLKRERKGAGGRVDGS
jgi:hypothetical protein